jgi:hypothetical protein
MEIFSQSLRFRNLRNLFNGHRDGEDETTWPSHQSPFLPFFVEIYKYAATLLRFYVFNKLTSYCTSYELKRAVIPELKYRGDVVTDVMVLSFITSLAE